MTDELGDFGFVEVAGRAEQHGSFAVEAESVAECVTKLGYDTGLAVGKERSVSVVGPTEPYGRRLRAVGRSVARLAPLDLLDEWPRIFVESNLVNERPQSKNAVSQLDWNGQ